MSKNLITLLLALSLIMGNNSKITENENVVSDVENQITTEDVKEPVADSPLDVAFKNAIILTDAESNSTQYLSDFKMDTYYGFNPGVSYYSIYNDINKPCKVTVYQAYHESSVSDNWFKTVEYLFGDAVDTKANGLYPRYTYCCNMSQFDKVVKDYTDREYLIIEELTPEEISALIEDTACIKVSDLSKGKYDVKGTFSEYLYNDTKNEATVRGYDNFLNVHTTVVVQSGDLIKCSWMDVDTIELVK